MERERIKIKYRDGNGDVHDWEEPSSRTKRGCMIPVAIVTGIVGFRFWEMLMEPPSNIGQAGAALLGITALIGICITVPVTIVFAYAVVGIFKPDWIWREPF